MIFLQIILIPPRFLKAIFLLGITYIYTWERLYRRSPVFFEKIGILAFQSVVSLLGIKISKVFLNTTPLPSKAIYISNHSSSFELFIMACLLKHTDYVIDAGVLKIPMIGKIMKRVPMIFIDRYSLTSRANGPKAICDHLMAGRNVMLFPEGYSHKYLGDHFAKGAFQAAIDANVPIIPIYLHYNQLDVFVPDAKVNHKKEFFKILFARNKTITAYFFDSVTADQFNHNVSLFRDNVYEMYRDWQKQYYGC